MLDSKVLAWFYKNESTSHMTAVFMIKILEIISQIPFEKWHRQTIGLWLSLAI